MSYNELKEKTIARLVIDFTSNQGIRRLHGEQAYKGELIALESIFGEDWGEIKNAVLMRAKEWK